MFGAEKGIRPAALGQCRRQPGELKKRPPDAFLPRCAPPFPSNPFLFHCINKKSTLLGTFLFGAEKGIRPAALGQCRRQPGELKKRPPDAFLPRCAPPFPSNPFLFHCINKKSTLLGTFLFGAEKGIRTLVTVPRKHDFQSCAFDQLSHLCKPLKYNTTFLCALQAESYIADKNSVT